MGTSPQSFQQTPAPCGVNLWNLERRSFSDVHQLASNPLMHQPEQWADKKNRYPFRFST